MSAWAVDIGPSIGSLLSDVGGSDLVPAFRKTPIPPSFARACGIALDLPPLVDAPPALTFEPPSAVLAGPGVFAADAVDALHTFARVANVGVANTFGAKGVFAWDSPFHLGTCGLQRDDFALLGFDAVDQIVAIGVDDLETPRDLWALAPVIDVDPRHLAMLATAVTPSDRAIERPALYQRIAAIAEPGYTNDAFPRHPARAVADLRDELPDAIVIAQPGPAGLWVGRVLPTDRPGRATVPAVAIPGIAAALALIAHRRGVEAVAVMLAPMDSVTRAVLDREPALAVRAWGDDVDWSRTADLVVAAGPVVAWTTGARLGS